MVTLNFNLCAFDRAAHTAPLFKLLAQRFQCVGTYRHTHYDGDSLAASAFGFSSNSHNTVADGCGPIDAADTRRHRAMTLQAQLTTLSAIDRARIRPLRQLRYS